jgi:hypothetical protein
MATWGTSRADKREQEIFRILLCLAPAHLFTVGFETYASKVDIHLFCNNKEI